MTLNDLDQGHSSIASFFGILTSVLRGPSASASCFSKLMA